MVVGTARGVKEIASTAPRTLLGEPLVFLVSALLQRRLGGLHHVIPALRGVVNTRCFSRGGIVVNRDGSRAAGGVQDDVVDGCSRGKSACYVERSDTSAAALRLTCGAH